MRPAGTRPARAWPFLATIRVRLTLWYVGLLAVTLVVFGIFTYLNLAREIHQEADHSLASDAQRLDATLDVADGRPGLGEANDSLETGTVVALYEAGGRQLLATTPGRPWPDMSAIVNRAAQGERTLTTVLFPDGSRWRVLTTPIVEDRRQVAVLQVARSMRDVDAILTRLMRWMAIAVPLVLLLAIVIGIFLAGRALNPIDRMTRMAARISAEDLTRRLGYAGNDEVGRLAATFDRMLDRLESGFERQRRFTADASHELRTPLASLVGQIDLALDRPRTDREYRDVLTSLRQDTKRLSQLTNELLSLARADAGHDSLVLEPLNLGQIVEDVVSAMQPLARKAGIQLAQRADASVVVAGDQTRLTQLLVNLIDNGLKHTPIGGSVTLDVRGDEGGAVISVTDTGTGIEPEHLAYVFERFYRAESARGRATGGSGLGLAICQRIAEAHGGEIRVSSRPGHGATFSVFLPIRS